MNFTIHGGYEIPRDNRIVTRDNSRRRGFWDEIDEDVPDLSGACGCYIVAIRGVPWYVGAAHRQDFKHECLSHHKITQIDAALSKSQGRPMLFLVARRTPRGKFCCPAGGVYRDVKFVEDAFIGMAIRRNSQLQNIRGTAFLKEIHLPGFFNSRAGEARAFPVRELRCILGSGAS